MSAYIAVLKKYLPTKTSHFFWFMCFLQFYYLYQVFVTNDVGGFSFTWASVVMIILSMFTVGLFFQLLASLFSFSKKLLIMSGFTYITFFGILAAYHFGSHELLDFSIVADNFSIAFTPESLQVIKTAFHMPTLMYVPAFIILFIFLEYFKKSISSAAQTKPYSQKLIAGILIYLFFIFAPIDSMDPVLSFFRSIVHYYQKVIVIDPDITKGPCPLLNDGKSFNNFTAIKNGKNYVFFIMVESLNFSALDMRNPEGRELTPFLNSLRNNCVYDANFYGNSVQTAKGHFASLFSTIPSISGKVFTKYDDLNILSIGSALKQSGYSTTYYIAHHKKNFDNEYNFLTARGYDQFQSVEDQLTQEDRNHEFEWGVEDSVYFKRFFNYFDKQQSNNQSRQFYTLATIANHFPFNSVPKDRRFIYKNPGSIKECYANSVYLADLGIKTFFEELKARKLLDNSLVIITADHAFPMGEHGNYHLLAGYNQESFRIPLFIYWQGKLKPRTIHSAHSQMDIAPTILDLLSVTPTMNNFQGHSIFDKNTSYPIYLIQPYGKHLCVVSYPLKYRFYDRTYQEFAYNISIDPMETTNIFPKLGESKKAYFRKELKHIYENQLFIKENAFWKKPIIN